ncbi:hypothetical protein AX17_000844 [Amanita inopinata Kibby_2008]|nr:hypothetical protein AX17_000844 [Amanita inopinata Kibby_2008]
MYRDDLCNYTTPQSKPRIVWNRITFSRLTIIYFCFSFVHFAVQLTLQTKALAVNANAAAELSNLVVNETELEKGLPILQGQTLKLCRWVPSNLQTDVSDCQVIWSGGGGGTTETVGHSDIQRSTVSLSAKTYEVKNHSEYVDNHGKLSMEAKIRDSTLVLRALDTSNHPDGVCQDSLIWPVTVLRNTKREDIVFIAFQFWVLGMSVVALLNESIPHILASLLTHLMATAWAAFQIKSTADFRSKFHQTILNGTCKHVELLPDYWGTRSKAELAALVLNAVSLLISSYLTWRLVKLFGWQTFKRVGASLTINRIYQLVLLLSIAIQLALFFMATTVSLWIDRLVNSAIGDLAQYRVLYKISSSITLTLLFPWLVAGWFGVRQELRTLTSAFLLLSVLYLCGWSVMFFSTTFRWTFVTWRFFSVMASASVFLTCSALILGIVCRFNFGKGLLRHLNGQHFVLGQDAKCNEPPDIEKVNFPTNEKPIPTYSSFFGGSPKAWAWGQTHTSSDGGLASLTTPLQAHVRNTSDASSQSSWNYLDFSRSSSPGSMSHSSDSSRVGYPGRRWVIE